MIESKIKFRNQFAFGAKALAESLRSFSIATRSALDNTAIFRANELPIMQDAFELARAAAGSFAALEQMLISNPPPANHEPSEN